MVGIRDMAATLSIESRWLEDSFCDEQEKKANIQSSNGTTLASVIRILPGSSINIVQSCHKKTMPDVYEMASFILSC